MSKDFAGGRIRSIGFLAAQVLFDAVIVNLSMLLAMQMRYEPSVPLYQIRIFSTLWPFMTVLGLASFYVTKMYKTLWRYASVGDALHIAMGTGLTMAATLAFGMVADLFLKPNLLLMGSKTVYPIAWLLLLMMAGAQRFGVRLVNQIGVKNRALKKESCSRVMVVGAGWAGASMIREFNARGFREGLPVVAVDDDPAKAGTRIMGIPVLPGVENIPKYVEKYQISEIVIAIPSASLSQRKQILDICTQTSCKLKLVPTLRDVTGNTEKIGETRDVNIADLLCREEVRLDMGAISAYLKDRVVLVTGGGGSIGSELCRQIARFEPKRLVIFDIYENNAYELANELNAKYDKALPLTVLIGSVRDLNRLEQVFEEIRPEVVFHAAAHKHVPLMEFSPAEAVKNNVFGTFNVARCADKYGARRMVTLSTDKAVNPTNVMGATKRVTEMILQWMARRSKTKFMAVRFGNVLGSNGSVIPLFMQQIARGGPVTVTHPEITRYFMTIPEASQLVLQAASVGESGNIFVLDMGTPVKIVDLARNLIRLSGLRPEEDIKISYCGLRPGEKLYEELMLTEEAETLDNTRFEKINVLRPVEIDAFFEQKLQALESCAAIDPSAVREMLKALVPTYREEPQEKKATA
jgi:FlaA1/EpsC-like NDP-sugar epimerase